MIIEVIENFLHVRDQFSAGETRIVPDELGAYFCRAGWARDIDGNVETAPRDIHRVVPLDVDGATHKTVAGDTNG